MKKYLIIAFGILQCLNAEAQNEGIPSSDFLPVTQIHDHQPVLAQAIRVGEALEAIGNPFPYHVHQQLVSLKEYEYTEQTI